MGVVQLVKVWQQRRDAWGSWSVGVYSALSCACPGIYPMASKLNDHFANSAACRDPITDDGQQRHVLPSEFPCHRLASV